MRYENNKIFWQILMWGGSWLLISFFLTNGLENPDSFTKRGVASLIGIVLVVIVNLQFLMPQFYFRKKHVFFILGGIILIIGVALIIHSEWMPWSEWFSYQRRSYPTSHKERGMRKVFSGVRWLGRMMPYIIAFLGSTLVEISWFANKKEKENLETELKFLKSQVNPHFLFNALNNIYSLAIDQAPETPESVIQLSEILRYMVYDANAEKVPLESEVNYIENYVNLKMLKDPGGMNVNLDLSLSSPGIMVPPLLFIPFVENAFKHSKIENSETGFINISLKLEAGSLEFKVVNSLPRYEFTKDKIGGVGLDNIQKRLHLLYPGNSHGLTIRRTKDQFEVNLVLKVE